MTHMAPLIDRNFRDTPIYYKLSSLYFFTSDYTFILCGLYGKVNPRKNNPCRQAMGYYTKQTVLKNFDNMKYITLKEE